MRRFLFVFLMSVIPTVVNAEGYYFSALVGQSKIDTGVSAVTGAKLDEEDTASSFYVGNQLSENFAIEGFYTDLGEASLSGNNGDTFTLDGSDYQFNTTGIISANVTTFGVAGKLKFEMAETLNGFLKGGLHFWDTEFTAATSTSSASVTDEGTDIVIGFGAEYEIGENLAFLVGYDSYTVDSEDVTFVNAGIKINFD